MPVYELETPEGKAYQIETDQEIDQDAPEGQQVLQRLLQRQLSQQNTPGSLATQALGGARDATQKLIDLPTGVANWALHFGDPPPGPGRQPAPPLQGPQLPEVAAPQTRLERGVRTGAELATDVFGFLAVPGAKSAMSRLLGPQQTLKGASLMFEPGAAAARGGITGQRPVPTLAKPSGVLLEELSEGAVNLANVLGLPATMPAIRSMSQSEAAKALQRLMATLGKDFHLTQQAGPVKDLWEVIEMQMLRYR